MLENIEKYLVARFDFEETTGNYVDKIGGAIAARTGATTVVGYEGNAVNFDGNDYLTLDKRIIPVGEKTIRFKIKTSIRSSAEKLIFINHRSTNYRGLGISLLNSRIVFYHRIGDGKSYIIGTSTDISDSKWHDIIFSWDGKKGVDNAFLLVDETLVSTTSVSNDEMQESEYAGVFGVFKNYANSFFYHFTGQLDEFEVYNKSLSSKELGKRNLYLFSQNNTAYTIENGTLKSLGTITTANASTLFASGVEAITKEHCVLVGQQLGKAKIIKMEI